MSESKTFTPIQPTAERVSAYRELGMTQEEFMRVLRAGHPGGTVSLSQADLAAKNRSRF